MRLSGLTEMCGFLHHHPEVAPQSSLDHSPACSQSPLDSPKARYVTSLMKPWPHPSLTSVSYFSPGPLSHPHQQESCALPPTSPRIGEEDKRKPEHQEETTAYLETKARLDGKFFT